MISRRVLLSATVGLAGCAAGETPAQPAAAAPPPRPFPQFLRDVRAEARRAGISERTLAAALDGLEPIPRVLELDRRQPEFVLTFAQYRDRQVTPARIARGRDLKAEQRALLAGIERRYRVPAPVVLAIWGVETNYGSNTGGFPVVGALATLAWEGRRASFFRNELLAALRILDAGHVQPAAMRGSWAGAMGQPQFMPSSFERFAVDHDGDGRRDIWTSRADALASIANYLARHGWREGEPWGREVRLPHGFDPALAGREPSRPLSAWARIGVRAAGGGALPASELPAGIVIPDGPTGPAFAVHRNFAVLRRYNPSDFYALSVGLLADSIGA